MSTAAIAMACGRSVEERIRWIVQPGRCRLPIGRRTARWFSVVAILIVLGLGSISLFAGPPVRTASEPAADQERLSERTPPAATEKTEGTGASESAFERGVGPALEKLVPAEFAYVDPANQRKMAATENRVVTEITRKCREAEAEFRKRVAEYWPYRDASYEKEQQASADALKEIHSLFSRAKGGEPPSIDRDEAVRRILQLAEKFPESPVGDEAYFLAAYCYWDVKPKKSEEGWKLMQKAGESLGPLNAFQIQALGNLASRSDNAEDRLRDRVRFSAKLRRLHDLGILKRLLLNPLPMETQDRYVNRVDGALANIERYYELNATNMIADATHTVNPQESSDQSSRSGTPVPDNENSTASARQTSTLSNRARLNDLQITLTSDRRDYFLGGNVILHYLIENRGQQPVTISMGGDTRNNVGRALRFKVEAIDQRGHQAPDPYPNPANFGGPYGDFTIKPGDHFCEDLRLMRYREPGNSGAYTIKVYHDFGLEHLGPDEAFRRESDSNIPSGPHKVPIVSTTIRFQMPTAEQARQIVDATLKVPTDWNRAIGQRGRPFADFALLRYPVYLPMMRGLADSSDARGLEAIGAMAFPEATEALLELSDSKNLAIAAKAQELLQARMPAIGDSRPSRESYLADHSWQPQLKAQAMQLAWRLLGTDDREAQIRAARVVRSIGDKQDLPRLIGVMDELLPAYKDNDVEQRAWLRPASVCDGLTWATRELIKRGASPPSAADTPGRAVAFLVGLQSNKDFRPPAWHETLLSLLKSNIPFLRALAVGSTPLPLSDEDARLVAERIEDAYPPVQAAACYLAGQSKMDRFGQPLVKLIQNTTNEWILDQSFRAAKNCGAQSDRLEEILVGRLEPRNNDWDMRVLGLMIETTIKHEGGSGAQNIADWQPFLGDLQAAWRKFIEANREALGQGRLIELGDPTITPEMFPPKYYLNLKGQPWPPSHSPFLKPASNPGNPEDTEGKPIGQGRFVGDRTVADSTAPGKPTGPFRASGNITAPPPAGLRRTELDVRITALTKVIAPVSKRLTNGQTDVLELPIRIENRSDQTISANIAREWHGGNWPPTDLGAAVRPLGNKSGKWRTSEVYLSGERGSKEATTVWKPGETHDFVLRMNWPGTGSVHGQPLIEANSPGKYAVRISLIFRVGELYRWGFLTAQYVVSPEMEINVQTRPSDKSKKDIAAKPKLTQEPVTAQGQGRERQGNPTAATLKEWLGGKEVVEVWFAGPHVEPLALRNSLHTKVAETDQDFRLTPGEGGGLGSFIEVVMTVTPGNVKRLLDLQAELAPRKYTLVPDRARVWSTAGDSAKRAQARNLIPDVASAFKKSFAKIRPDAKFTPYADSRHGFGYDLGGGQTGSFSIVAITPLKLWYTEIIPDQSVHLPRLGLMATSWYRPSLPRGSEQLSSTHSAIRRAFRDAVSPLLALEPGVEVRASDPAQLHVFGRATNSVGKDAAATQASRSGTPVPDVAVLKDATKQAKAIAEIEKLGGKVTVDKKSPGKPVIRVDLHGSEVTDAALEHVKGLTELQTLNLWQTKVTDAGLVHLKGLTKLQGLDLQGSEVTDAGLEHLKGLTELQTLDLWRTKLTGAGLVHLRGLTKLQLLEMSETKVTDAGLEHLKALTRLEALSLGSTKVTDAGLEHLKGLTQLQSLNLFNTQVTDAGLERLKGLTQLQRLELGDTQVTDAGLEHIKGLSQLQSLTIFSTQVTDKGLEHLQGLTQLQMLHLARTRVTDAGLGHLEGLTKLQTLYLGDTQVTGVGLRHLEGLTNLETLGLDDTQVSDAGLEHLEKLTKLQFLNLCGTRVTDAGLVHLKSLTKLEQVYLGHTKVTDAGLEHLKGLTQLRILDLSETGVTDEGVKRLQQALPNCEIKRDIPSSR